MFFAIATRITVASPETSAQFLKDVLGFQTSYREGYGWWAENGSVTLILEEGECCQTVLELHCSDLEADAQALLQQHGIRQLSAIEQIGRRLQQLFRSDCGIVLKLSKILSEDDLDELPELPSSLAWNEKTMRQTQRILRVVPIDFRDKVRQRVTEKAEYLAILESDLCVEESHAMQAFVKITLPFQHGALFEAMVSEGIEATFYMSKPESLP